MLKSGDRVDRYTVEALIGEGGMARVYRVRHTELGRRFALKVPHSPDPTLLARLHQEGQVQARLEHPNIVKVTDWIEVGGAPGLIMDYVDGPTLAEHLARGPLDLAEADRIARGVIAGVAAAHAAGVLHRDLKPANILLKAGPEGPVPMVADFGLAKLLRGDPLLKTRAGTLLGTPAYTAPEVLESSSAADVRSDIFSLGALLYELVCGCRPFQGQELFSLMRVITAGVYEPVHVRVPEVPERMEDAIEGALELDPELRIASCEELLERWTRGALTPERPPEPAPTPPAERPRGRARALGPLSGLVGLALLSGVLGSVGLWWAGSTGPDDTEPPSPPVSAGAAAVEEPAAQGAAPEETREPTATAELAPTPAASPPEAPSGAPEPPEARASAQPVGPPPEASEPPVDDAETEGGAKPQAASPGALILRGDLRRASLRQGEQEHPMHRLLPGVYSLYGAFGDEEPWLVRELEVQGGGRVYMRCYAEVRRCVEE